jgi:predicted lipid-binding transport protein (Tim44 family)
MIRRLSPTALALLGTIALLAGCGSSSSSSSSSNSSSTAATGASTGSTNSGASTSTGTSTAPANSSAKSAAVAQCKHGVGVLPTLSQATKSRLEAICEKAAGGDAKAAGEAAREACEEIVKASPLPAGSARDHALSGCKGAEKPEKK